MIALLAAASIFMPGVMWPLSLDKPPCAKEFAGGVLPADCTPWTRYHPHYVLDPTPINGMTDCNPKGKTPWGFRCVEVRVLQRENNQRSQFIPTADSIGQAIQRGLP